MQRIRTDEDIPPWRDESHPRVDIHLSKMRKSLVDRSGWKRQELNAPIAIAPLQSLDLLKAESALTVIDHDRLVGQSGHST